MLPTMGSGLGGTGSTGVGGPCPYTTPTNPYSMYHHRATAEPTGTAMSSSIATLRLKAKQHSSGFSSPYSTQSSSISPVSRSSNSGGLAACQYASVTDSSVWDNALVGTLFQATSSLNHLLNSEHELNFDQRGDDVKSHHHQGSNGTPTRNVPTDDDDDRNDGNALINNNDINE